jgi:hypothetical protein
MRREDDTYSDHEIGMLGPRLAIMVTLKKPLETHPPRFGNRLPRDFADLLIENRRNLTDATG